MGLLGVSEGLDTHGLAGGQQDNGGVTRLDELGVVLGRLTGTAVNLLLDLSKLASNVSGVAIKDGAVAVGDLSRVVEDNDLGGEVRAAPAGLFLESEATYPLLMSLTETFLTLKPTLSPGTALGRDSWCISTDLTSVVKLLGAKVMTMPGLMIPVSTRPTGTVPMPPILTSWRGKRRGLSVGRVGGMMASRASKRVVPFAFPSLRVISQPLYQDMLVEGSNMLSPCHPEMGTKGTAAGL